MLYLGLMVLLPLSTVFVGVGSMSWHQLWDILVSERVLAALQLTFGASLAAAMVNVFLGFLVAWVLVRYSFTGRRLLDGLIDLPFALPTAVAGIALTAIYSPTGTLGAFLSSCGVNVAFTPLGVFLALMFVSFPFVVRSVQPVLQDLDPEFEEAAASLGASPLRIFFSIILPSLWPGILSGFSLAFARALGEYGSVVFISGNLPFRTEIVPLLIMSRLEQFDYSGACALAFLMLVISFLLMFVSNYLQLRWTRRGTSGG